MLLNIFSNIVTMKKVSFVKYLIKQKTQRNVNIAISQECRKCELMYVWLKLKSQQQGQRADCTP